VHSVMAAPPMYPPTPAEEAAYGPQFAALDTDRDGLVAAAVMTDLLRRTLLPQPTLAQVRWPKVLT